MASSWAEPRFASSSTTPSWWKAVTSATRSGRIIGVVDTPPRSCDQSLVVARAAGVDRVLVTYANDNVGSSRVIEANGGRLENIVDIEGQPLRRYWID